MLKLIISDTCSAQFDMMKPGFTFALQLVMLALFGFSCSAGSHPLPEQNPDKKYCIAFYNVENLFNAKDDPEVDDAEFTPEGQNHWTDEKYQTKLHHIAKVIASMNDGRGPDVVGLSEIENAGVLKDLIATSELKPLHYSFLHEESPDKRGIDVCMLYKEKSFRILGHQMLTVDISSLDDKPTRSIMMVQGIAGKKDTLYFFLNHWPSRRGGTEQSEPKREIAAKVLRTAVDSLLLLRPNAGMVIMGDFNDNPPDHSITDVLKAQRTIDPATKNSLYDAASVFKWKEGEGSEFYRGSWSRFIQFIFTTSLIKEQLGSDGLFHDIYIYKPDWLLIADPAYQQMVPFRTYDEDSKEMGYSDHLPVYVLLKIR